MTYLQIVNAVLSLLREDTVASVASDTYSKLIGKFVNDAKRQVEDAWEWDALSTTIPITTVAGTSNYVVTGIGRRFKGVTVNDDTNNFQLRNVKLQWIIDQQQITYTTNTRPSYFAWNGTNGTDTKIELFPTPDGTYTIQVNANVPQAELTNDTDVLKLNSYAVEMGAYARALVERGEDGGFNSSEAYGLFKGIMSDEIAVETSRQDDYNTWMAV